jgi:hypothetical protein
MMGAPGLDFETWETMDSIERNPSLRDLGRRVKPANLLTRYSREAGLTCCIDRNIQNPFNSAKMLVYRVTLLSGKS